MIDPLYNRRLSFRRRWKHVIFLLLRIFVLPTLRLVLRFKVHGLDNVPRSGGALVISNHVHNADPILILSASPRPILWMAKVEVWSIPVLRWFASQAGAFPVDRGKADRHALAKAVETLKEGMLVGMFPEGTRSVTGGLKEPFTGVSLVAVRSGAPIVPCVIVGSRELPLNGAKQERRRWRYPRVEVLFGPPFRLNPVGPDGKRYRSDDLTDAMMIELARISPPSMRGIYAERNLRSHPAVRRDAIEFPEQ